MSRNWGVERIWAVHMVLMTAAGSRERKLGMGDGRSGAELLMAGRGNCVCWVGEGHILLRVLWSRNCRRVLVGGSEVYEPSFTL